MGNEVSERVCVVCLCCRRLVFHIAYVGAFVFAVFCVHKRTFKHNKCTYVEETRFNVE